MARIGLLTGGGDCPGLNAVIRGIVRQGARQYGDDFVGLRHGWAGVLAGEGKPLGLPEVSGLLTRGGTILGSSRTNPYRDGGGGTEAVTAGMEKLGLDGLIAIGGEDTLGVATKLALALAVGIAFPLLELFGFVPGATDTTDGLFALAILYAWVPVAFKAVAGILVFHFEIDAETQAGLRRRIEGAGG